MKITPYTSFPTFLDYVDRCLYDPFFGYYSSGRVRFGKGKHYWTYPVRASPVFGWMIAEFLRHLLDQMQDFIPEYAPIHIIELGAGQGDLSKDILDYIHAHSHQEGWKIYVGRLQYRIYEKSSALCRLQRKKLKIYIEKGQVEVIEKSFDALEWKGSFYGIVIANEVLDNFPFERIRIRGLDDYRRIRLVPSNKEMPDTLDIWSQITKGVLELSISEYEETIPKTNNQDPLSDIQSYLNLIRPLIEDLSTLGLLPCDIPWSPYDKRFINIVASLARKGICLCIIIDYGGSSRHILDPNSIMPHIRVYGDKRFDGMDKPYVLPGRLDITRDVDFTYLDYLAQDCRMKVIYYGLQSSLETFLTTLDSPRCKKALAYRISVGKVIDEAQVARQVQEVIDVFRMSPGFFILCIAPRDLRPRSQFLDKSLDPRDMDTIKPNVSLSKLRRIFSKNGIPNFAINHIHPCGDPIASLSFSGFSDIAVDVFKLLKKQGCLTKRVKKLPC